MKCEEVKEYYECGQLSFHYLEDENGNECGEYREYHENGQLLSHCFLQTNWRYGEVKVYDNGGELDYHYLEDGEGDELAVVVNSGHPGSHSAAELIEIAKEHNLPLLEDIPKTEAEVTLWNLKYPECPCLPISTE